jgi:exopolysaccharide biosynthesis polyprenyl glycosylphosphotransferase
MLVVPVDVILLMSPILWAEQQVRPILAVTVLSIMLIAGSRYRARLHLSVLDELPSLVGKLLVAAALVGTVIALRHQQEAVATFLVGAAISTGLVVCGRMVTTRVIAWSRCRRLTAHPTIVIGGGPLAAELAQVLRDHAAYGLWVLGFVDDASDGAARSTMPQLGGLDDLDHIVHATGADVLLVADGHVSERVIYDIVRTPRCQLCDLLVVPRMHYFHTQTGQADHIGSIPVMRIRTPSLCGPAWALKRLFDIVSSGTALLLVLPILGVCALAVRLDTGPGIIFRQSRVGRDGVVFDCLKLRSMRPTDDIESATQWSVATDRRVSRTGRFLRRTSLDEIPQLWNILRGDMTLVGPRPERPHFVDRFSAEFDRYAHRHRVRAGLTGLAQVNGLRGDTSIAARARYDNYYIEHWSLWLDVKILVRTFSEVFLARGR